jgi:multidrug efflux pump subunit AcrA (membrane-fusion protein)
MAESDAPAASIITATVQKQVLERTVIVRGAVTAGNGIHIGHGTLRTGGSLTEAAGDDVLTAVNVSVADQVTSGQVIAEVSGRPLLVLPGGKAMYRDITPGDSGTDVRQLQEALAALGYETSVDGEYGKQTQSALKRLYGDRGYEAQTSDGGSGEDEAELRAARNSVRDAQAALDQIERGQSQYGEGADGSVTEIDLARAQNTLTEAETALSSLQSRTGVVAPRLEVVFIESLPAYVAAVSANVNVTVPEVIAVVTADDVRVTANVPLSQAALLADGGEATIALPSGNLGGTIGGRGAADQDSGSVPVFILPGSPLDYSLIGLDIKVTFTTAKTNSAVLAVPLGAISSDGAGRRYVIVEDEHKDLVRCEVRVGVTGDDLVEVTPAAAGGLQAGDRVVISG